MTRYGATERKPSIKFKILAILLLLSLILPVHELVYASAQPTRFIPTPPGQPPSNHAPDQPQVREPEPSFVWNSEMIREQHFEMRAEGLDILGTMPVIDRSYPPSQVLNDLISEAERSFINSARRLRARYVTLSYEVQITGELVSIIIYADVASTITRSFVQSVNFNHRTGRVVSLNDSVGVDMSPLLDRILIDMIRRNPERYYAALRGPMIPQAFFKNATHLVLLFDEFQLSTFAGGISRIELERENIHIFTVAPHVYHTNRSSDYNVKMMPLRHILEVELGYTLRWSPDPIGGGIHIRVFRNDQIVVEMSTDANHYRVHGVGAQIRSLEAPPQLADNGTIYVPITFFDQILSMTTYSIDALGNITFLAYIYS